jgi:SEC-C motif
VIASLAMIICGVLGLLQARAAYRNRQLVARLRIALKDCVAFYELERRMCESQANALQPPGSSVAIKRLWRLSLRRDGLDSPSELATPLQLSPRAGPAVSAICYCRAAIVKQAAGGKYCERCGHWWEPKHGSTIPAQLVIGDILPNLNLIPDRARIRTGRNEPCPCGSRLKYKRCCGGARPRAK